MKMLTKEACERALQNLRMLEREDNFKKWGGQVAPQISCDVLDQLIKEHFELVENIKWLKEEMTEPAFNLVFSTQESLHNWYKGIQMYSSENAILKRKLSEYENPQPYKFKELKKGMWVWMVWFKEGAEKGKFAKILNTYTTPPYYYNDEDGEEHERVEFRIGDGSGTIDFDAWKFYPPTKAMEYQE